MWDVKILYRVVWTEGQDIRAIKGRFVREEDCFLVFSLHTGALISLNKSCVIKIEELGEARE